MKRLARWVFNGLAVLSLVLCLATCALWVRSRWVEDSVSRNFVWNVKLPDGRTLQPDEQYYGTSVAVESYKSGLVLALRYCESTGITNRPDVADDKGQAFPAAFHWNHGPIRHSVFSKNMGRFGIIYEETYFLGFSDVTISFDHSMYRYGASDWLIVLTTAILPAIYAASTVKRLRSKRNPFACAKCGYDLRATPERCPECGTIPATATL